METAPTVTEVDFLDAYWRAARDQAYVHHHGEAGGGSGASTRCVGGRDLSSMNRRLPTPCQTDVRS